MRIGFVTSSVSRNAGGLYESVRRLAQSMTGSASQVSVFGLEDGYTAADRVSWEPLKVRTFAVRGPKRFGFAPSLVAALESSGIRLAMSHGLWMYPSVAVRQWHEKTQLPYVVHPHGMLEPWAVRNSAFRKRLAALIYENAHLRGAACIRALCKSEAESIRAYGLTNPIAVIPNGIDLPETMQSTECRMHSAESSVIGNAKRGGRKVLLFLGRIHPKKGLPNLIRAWAQVKVSGFRSHPSSSEWVLAIAGWDQGGHEGELKQLATQLGIAWADTRDRTANEVSGVRLVFTGPQFGEGKAECYRDCEAFILPSFSEGLPMAVLEAWAHGKPVLMTAECNLPEGFAADAAVRIGTQAQSIVEGLEWMMRVSESELLGSGERGRALVAERFAWPRIATQMREVYEWVLGGGTKPGCVISSER